MVEVDANNISVGSAIIQFEGNSDGSSIKGLVLNNNGANGDGIAVLADDIVIQGNYIGTNAAGSAAKPNAVGINSNVGNPESGRNVLIGGLDAEDRNLISGNTAGTTGTASYPGGGVDFPR